MYIDNELQINNIRFELPDSFIEPYSGKQPEWGPLGYVVYKRTYARRIENRTEEFFETVRRAVEGSFTLQKRHCLRLGLPWSDIKALKSAKLMYQKIWNFKFTPPGRGLWMMGTKFIDKQGTMCLFNCSFCSTEDIAIKGSLAFVWCMDALMLGVGVGFDTKGAGKITIQEPDWSEDKFQIPDSRQGWLRGLKYILDGYFGGTKLPGFDYSQIRKKGELIKGFGGVAAGPEPLKELYRTINILLSERVNKIIRSSDIVDIFNMIGKAVVAGNVRRSAEVALGELEDEDFLYLKDDPEKLRDYRWASNNSIIGKVGMDYSKIVEILKNNGEPGIFWMENARNYSRMNGLPDRKDIKAVGINPCGEITLESFEMCNLAETFPSRHDSYAEYEETLKSAYLYAKSVTLANTHWPVTNAVMLKNRRLGISQTGIIDAFVKHGRRNLLNWCEKGYSFLRNLDEIYSNWLCVPKSIKITTVKPSGSVSLLPGVSPGIHYPHSKYYIRRIRLADDSDLVPVLEKAGYHIEKDLVSDRTFVVSFPIYEKNFKQSKEDVTIWEQFVNAADYQKYWSDNQVSITISFKEDEVQDIERCLEAFETKLKGVTLLPFANKFYKQQPYEEISSQQYEQMISCIKTIDLNGVQKEGIGVSGCSNDVCEISPKSSGK